MAAEHHIGWFEIFVNDFDKAKEFYSELFGWQFNKSNTLGNPFYWIIYTGEGSVSGGLMKKTEPQHTGSAVILYAETEDINATLNKAEQLGGKTIKEKTLINEKAGYYALFTDIDNNTMGLWSKS